MAGGLLCICHIVISSELWVCSKICKTRTFQMFSFPSFSHPLNFRATHINHIPYAVTTDYRLQSATVTLLRMSTSVVFLRTNAPSATVSQVRDLVMFTSSY